MTVRPLHARRGTVLLVVVGLSVVLLAMSVTYTVSIRSDAMNVRSLMLQAQGRVALNAACLYILETGRIGWGEEAFGWLDIRDASRLDRSLAPLNASGSIVTHAVNPLPGPRGLDGRQLPKRPDNGWAVNPAAAPILRWPALGGAARVTMLPPELPPMAMRGLYSYNPIPRDRAALAKPDMAQYVNLDPQPLGFPESESSASWSYPAGAEAAWRQGGRTVAGDPDSLATRSRGAVAWFRVFRSGFDTFIITVGGGGTQGYRDWAEVGTAGATAQFFGNPALYAELAGDERRMWFEARWSPSVAGRTDYVYSGQMQPLTNNGTGFAGSLALPGNTGMELIPLNYDVYLFKKHYAQPHRSAPINQMGTISWLRRLNREPALW